VSGTVERTGNIMGGRLLSSITPVALSIVGLLIASFPVSFLGGLVPAPLFVFMPLYFWAMVRPDLMTPFWAFALGVLQDLLSGGPPGIWAASFLAAYFLIDRQRDMLAGLSGIGAIAGFAVATLTACLSAYVIFALYHWHLPPPAPLLVELAMTVLFYIPAVFAIGIVHRRLVGPYRSDF
jgi:rod shape-determining protein MreD